MSDSGRPRLNKLPSGVPNLDAVLGGGIPEYSFNVIAGGPGAGKTTLCHQIMFANASPERPALYFTVIGEPPIKMLRYQQQFTFFDPRKIGSSIHFINLGREANEDLEAVLSAIIDEVARRNPALVFVDSFRSLAIGAGTQPVDGNHLGYFLQRLTLHMTGLQATTFLVGEYAHNEPNDRDHPLFTIADGIVWMSQNVNRNSMVRKIQALKMRGQETQPGLHTIRMTEEGVSVFPRMVKPIDGELRLQPMRFISSGIAPLDEMLGGGIVAGSALLVCGPAGSGKSTVAIQFLAEGVAQGETGVLAMFEETPLKYLEQAQGYGIDLQRMSDERKIWPVYLRPLDLSVDETLHQIQNAVREVDAKRVVIDSLTGLEIALAPTFEQDFRESLYRLIGALTSEGITIIMTVENTDAYADLRFSPHAMSFMTNDIILQRYVEIESQLKRVMTVIKSRSRKHSEDIRSYDITSAGIVIGERFSDFEGIVSGQPQHRGSRRVPHAGLTGQEESVLAALVELRRGSEREMATHTGLQRTVIARALRRLLELGYAERVTAEGATVYLPAERDGGKRLTES